MINLYNILVVKASLNNLWKYNEFVFLQEFVQICSGSVLRILDAASHLEIQKS